MRRGERLPAPASIDVNVHAGPQGVDSFAASEVENVVGVFSSKPDDKEKAEIEESLSNE
jgi:hypothetical protein